MYSVADVGTPESGIKQEHLRVLQKALKMQRSSILERSEVMQPWITCKGKRCIAGERTARKDTPGALRKGLNLNWSHLGMSPKQRRQS